MDSKFGKFKLLNLLIYFTYTFDMTYGTTNEFVIKNMHCGKYVIPRTTNNVPDNDPLVMWDDFYTHTRYRFEPVEGMWGYIREVKSNKVWQPLGGSSSTKTNDVDLVLRSTEARWALFAIDQVNNRIIHRDGLFVDYNYGTNAYPPNGDVVELNPSIHQGMNWAFLNPKNLSQQIYPYGAPMVLGKWEMVFAVENPLATQTWEYSYTLGKSNSRSTSQTYEQAKGYEFSWEASISASMSWNAWAVSGDISTSAGMGSTSSSSTSWQVQTASEDTWYGEVQETSTIEVVAGETVVVWQKVFVGSQLGHRAVFQSNHFGYTDNVKVLPKDIYVESEDVKPEVVSAKPENVTVIT